MLPVNIDRALLNGASLKINWLKYAGLPVDICLERRADGWERCKRLGGFFSLGEIH